MIVTESQLSSLMSQTLSGDSVSYEKLLNAVADISMRFLSRKQIPEIDRDDIIQDVLLSVHHAKKTYTPGQSCIAWIHAILRFKLADFFRRKYKLNSRETEEDLDQFLYEDCIEKCIETAELSNFLNQQLNKLSPMQKDIIVKMKFEGLSIKDVAQQLRISESNVKINAFRGYKKIHTLLLESPHYFTCIFLTLLCDYLSTGHGA